jgi:hypothetical protein
MWREHKRSRHGDRDDHPDARRHERTGCYRVSCGNGNGACGSHSRARRLNCTECYRSIVRGKRHRPGYDRSERGGWQDGRS